MLAAAAVIYIVVAITVGYHLPLVGLLILFLAVLIGLFVVPPVERGIVRLFGVGMSGIRWLDRA